MKSSKANELYKILKEETDVFGDRTGNFIFSPAVPGAGKTTMLVNTLRLLYGEYSTEKEYQIYKKEDGNELIIPAGMGNQALEDEETFLLKTNYRNDLYYNNRDLKTAVIAFNSAIAKEFKKRAKNDSILKEVEDNLTIRTSHSLFFKLAEKMGMFPKRNEEGIYEENGVKVNFAKGNFTFSDSLAALRVFEKSAFLKSVLDRMSNEERFQLAKYLLEVFNSYYESDIIFNSSKDYEKLFELALKNIEEEVDLEEYFNNVFTEEERQAIRDKKNKNPAYYLFDKFVGAMKYGINNGMIELCHSYYYKEVFLECMYDKDILPELFSPDNDTQNYFNIIMVDEAQDLTPIMTRLLIEYYKYAQENNLNVSMVIVGDRRQAIYGFANRQDAFEVIEKNLGKERINSITLNKTYRLPASICNFVNESCKHLGIYKEDEKVMPALEEKQGFVYPKEINFDELCYYFVEKNEPLMVVGRTNAEITYAYIKAFDYMYKNKPEWTKYLKIESKLKKDFKKILEKGINGIDDKKLIEKLQIALGKEKFTIKEVMNNKKAVEVLPKYIKNIFNIYMEFDKEIIEKALSQRTSKNAAVLFCTGHASKGLEAEAVYVLDGIYDSIVPKKNPEVDLKDILNSFNKEISKKEEIQADALKEEKNLFYVMATRAKRMLFLDERLLSEFKHCIKNEKHQSLIEKFENGFNEMFLKQNAAKIKM